MQNGEVVSTDRGEAGAVARAGSPRLNRSIRGAVQTGSTQQRRSATTTAPSGGIANGVAVLRAALRNVPAGPGRLPHARPQGRRALCRQGAQPEDPGAELHPPAGLSNRLRRMVAETTALEIVVTATEAEALLLECNLIKRLMPRYNVLLRDDKSFPFIHITADHDFPQLTKHRGARDKGGTYFGPFASAGAVNRTLIALQKAFLLRSCSDSVFANRTRPCLLVPDQALQRALRRPHRARRTTPR